MAGTHSQGYIKPTYSPIKIILCLFKREREASQFMMVAEGESNFQAKGFEGIQKTVKPSQEKP